MKKNDVIAIHHVLQPRSQGLSSYLDSLGYDNDRQPVTVFKSLNDRKSDIFLKFKETKEPIQFKLSDVD